MELIDFFLLLPSVLLVGLVGGGGGFLLVRYLRSRPKVSTGPDLSELARVLLDVQQRALESFIQSGLKGAQLRHELFQGTTRLTYGLKRMPNGIEHGLSVSTEGKPPPVAGNPADDKANAELAHFTIFVTQLARLEPVDPLDIENDKRRMGVTRTLTELETRTMKRAVVVPQAPELTKLWESSLTMSKALWKS